MVDFTKLKPWEGKASIVLGANSAIGAAVIEKLIQNGLFVFAVDLKMDLLEVKYIVNFSQN